MMPDDLPVPIDCTGADVWNGLLTLTTTDDAVIAVPVRAISKIMFDGALLALELLSGARDAYAFSKDEEFMTVLEGNLLSAMRRVA